MNGADRDRADEGHLPASGAGTGLVPEDQPVEVGKPASEEDEDALAGAGEPPPVSWPGGGGPGTIPPPG